MRFYWVIENRLGGSSIPRSMSELNEWIKRGVNIVISLVEEREFILAGMDYRQFMNELVKNRVCIIRFPIRDGFAPTDEQLLQLCKIIDEYLKENKVVIVHCYNAIGRTVVVLAAYLVYRHGLTVDEALQKIQQVNPAMSLTDEQYMALVSFELYLKRLKELEEAQREAEEILKEQQKFSKY